jgi:rubrerythrin
VNSENILKGLVELENKLSDLYSFFAGHFEEDRKFWTLLAGEEKEHARLLSEIDDSPPPRLLTVDPVEIQGLVDEISEHLLDFRRFPPSADDALNLAYMLEQSAGEKHYQSVVEERPVSRAVKIFQRLNAYDRDHAVRIRAYLQKKQERD